MEKLKLVKALSNKKDSSTELTRVRKSTNALANVVARQAGISKLDAIQKLVEFAYENIEWMESE
jgi:hypothetical protein